MRIEGAFRIAAPRAEVWKRITDPALMASCVPGCEAIERQSPTRYGARVKLAVGPIKASFNLVVEVVREEPPERVRSTTRGEEGSRASIVSAENVVALVEIDPVTTEVSYSSDVSVTGRLGKFGLGVMRKKAESMGADFVAAFRARVEDAGAAAGAAPAGAVAEGGR
ncbi:MAG TPA: carbon monoxide dehydrogenase subunit G [Alphaproteobacteria bacterium]|nr:carbon monoxide dehydrogenase subunit G [Alphaproteobacteria bacterium]